MHDDVAVVLLNYNGAHFLQKFLPAIIEFSGEAKIFVIDNGSTDQSVNLVHDLFKTVTLIELGQNYGFCQGYNEGIKQIDLPYYILINTDVEVTAGWLDPLLSLLKQNPLIAACQPKILDHKNRSQFEYAGAAGGFIDKFGYPFCRGRVFDTLEQDFKQYDMAQRVFWATGACLAIKSALFHQAGGFDTHFFAHMEEIDLCWRLQRMGYEVWCCPSATVYHVGGGTLAHTSPFKTFLNFRNGLLLLLKNLNGSELAFVIFIRLVLDGMAAIYFLIIKGNPRMFWAVIKAHFSFYFHFRKIWRKRGIIQKPNRKTLHGMIYRSILMQYFIKKHKHFTEIN